MPERPEDRELERSTNQWMMWGAGLMAVMVLIFPIYLAYEPSSRDEARQTHLASLAEQGEALYTLNCSSCHGFGDTAGTAPILNSEQFLASADDEQIEVLIAVGVPGSAMSAYSLDFGGPLTSEQIDALTVYLRSLEDDAPDRPDWRDPQSE